MTQSSYAFIKDNLVVNIALFENLSEETYTVFKEQYDLDDIVLIPFEKMVGIGSTFDGVNFWLPQPYSSWTKDEEINEWVAPVSLPEDARTTENPEGKRYVWDEPSLSWKLAN